MWPRKRPRAHGTARAGMKNVDTASCSPPQSRCPAQAGLLRIPLCARHTPDYGLTIPFHYSRMCSLLSTIRTPATHYPPPPPSRKPHPLTGHFAGPGHPHRSTGPTVGRRGPPPTATVPLPSTGRGQGGSSPRVSAVWRAWGGGASVRASSTLPPCFPLPPQASLDVSRPSSTSLSTPTPHCHTRNPLLPPLYSFSPLKVPVCPATLASSPLPLRPKSAGGLRRPGPTPASSPIATAATPSPDNQHGRRPCCAAVAEATAAAGTDSDAPDAGSPGPRTARRRTLVSGLGTSTAPCYCCWVRIVGL